MEEQEEELSVLESIYQQDFQRIPLSSDSANLNRCAIKINPPEDNALGTPGSPKGI